ncbi:MAG: hypothetical protein FWD56_08005, partial [Bacteroidales bacterium]|nr:hypothetical protein [Bacteroidales bacterium]
MKRILFTWLGVAALLFGSCSRESLLWNDEEEKVPVNTLRLYVDVQGLGAESAITRSTIAPELGEDQITSLYLLFFEPNTTRNGMFVDYVEVTGPLTIGSNIDIDLRGTEVNVTDPYHILVIANIDGVAGKRYLDDLEVTPWMLQWVNKTENQVMSEARAWAVGGTLGIAPSGLLMNSRVEKAREQFHVHVLLNRNQARFDVINELKENYDLVSVEIRNAYPTSSIWKAGEIDYSTAAARIPHYYQYNNGANTTGMGADGHGAMLKDIYGHLYTFENQVSS